ncbi:ATP synthase F1 subunit epsilon [Candidatus Pelagibacter sp.]|jgi:F-type H+-transporting ATPase subunit epsilon/F-type H+-transporting ATPase subunit delta|nr:ATP synthase F1 subunit epsilon [Candidatus Pelagibacter sp.]MDC3074174.1 ATP synthase F1 subunit epsilon [Candidatus Pelagibacter sp.]|tara:strand:+ start:114 stop:506 length:393 start_codon:yes stop_codon:yes gene_type:complete
MSEEFKIEIVNPEKSFLVKDDVSEVVVPAYEGEMGILKDHISIISFLKPGIIKILSKSGDESYYIEDGIVEFKNNNLSILTSSIFNIADMDKSKQQDLLKQAEEESGKEEISDQSRYLIDQKIEVLKTLN